MWGSTFYKNDRVRTFFSTRSQSSPANHGWALRALYPPLRLHSLSASKDKSVSHSPNKTNKITCYSIATFHSFNNSLTLFLRNPWSSWAAVPNLWPWMESSAGTWGTDPGSEFGRTLDLDQRRRTGLAQWWVRIFFLLLATRNRNILLYIKPLASTCSSSVNNVQATSESVEIHRRVVSLLKHLRRHQATHTPIMNH